MRYRTEVALSSVALSLLAWVLTASGKAPEVRQPNVLLIVADDLRFDAVHALGRDQIETPHMDSLVSSGTTFANAYIMGGTSPAVCAPSRAMLMTGRTLFHLEQQGASRFEISEKFLTLPEHLRRQGYETFGIGKQHNGSAVFSRGFTGGESLFFGGMSDHYLVPVHSFDASGAYLDTQVRPHEGIHSSELFAKAAENFLQNRQGKRPFFLYLSFTAPHDPRQFPESYGRMYAPEEIRIPPNFLPEHPFDNGELRVRDERLVEWPRTPTEIRRHLFEYYAIVSHLDAQLGRVLQALEDSGEADNTLVVFTSDNGLALGQHGLMGKQSVYEHSVHVPLIFRGPGIPRGLRIEAFAYLFDIFPTLCELLEFSVPETVEGQTLAPAMTRPDTGWTSRSSLFFAYRDFQRAVTEGDWKLIRYCVAGQQHQQLFNLKEDPWESRNLADDPQHHNRLQELSRLLLDLSVRLDDPADLEQSDWGFGTRKSENVPE